MCTGEVGLLKNIICASVVNTEKLLLGTEEGVYAYEMAKEKLTRIDDIKKVLQVEVIPEEQLIVVLTGKRDCCLSCPALFFSIF